MFSSDLSNYKLIQEDIGLFDNSKTEFIDLFNALHRDTEYYKHLDIRTFRLPDIPSEAIDLDVIFEYDTSVFFVDGCKSWYSTKWFIYESIKYASNGAYYLFQDYGRFTCFWIPFVLHLLSDKFEFLLSVDTTQVFVLKSTEQLDDSTPILDSPHDYSKDEVISVFNNIMCNSTTIFFVSKIFKYLSKLLFV
mgnify:CR=1 FL=1